MEQPELKRGDHVIVFPQTDVYLRRITSRHPRDEYRYRSHAFDDPYLYREQRLEKVSVTNRLRECMHNKPMRVLDIMLQDGAKFVGIDASILYNEHRDLHDPMSGAPITMIYVPIESTHNTNIHVMATISPFATLSNATDSTSWIDTRNFTSTGISRDIPLNKDTDTEPATTDEFDGVGVRIAKLSTPNMDMRHKELDKIDLNIKVNYKPIKIEFKDERRK